MSALLKIYSDSGHTTEITHTAQNSTTLNGATSIGATSVTVTSATGMPAQGYVDIDTAGSLETIAYTSISSNTLNLASACANAHSNGVAVVQWYYSLPVGDQTNGIINDGTQATPTSNNTNTYYIYNAGNQTAQNPTIATASGGASTTSGYADTLVSVTSSSSGFATSVSPANITSGSVLQMWVVAEIPTGQSNASNPQVCQINATYQTV